MLYQKVYFSSLMSKLKKNCLYLHCLDQAQITNLISGMRSDTKPVITEVKNPKPMHLKVRGKERNGWSQISITLPSFLFSLLVLFVFIRASNLWLSQVIRPIDKSVGLTILCSCLEMQNCCNHSHKENTALLWDCAVSGFSLGPV